MFDRFLGGALSFETTFVLPKLPNKFDEEGALFKVPKTGAGAPKLKSFVFEASDAGVVEAPNRLEAGTAGVESSNNGCEAQNES